MNCEFVNAEASDGVNLQGLVFTPQKADTVLVWIHGFTSSFHNNHKRITTLAKILGDAGFAFASFDTRGHDVISFGYRRDKRKKKGYRSVTIGSAYENFKDCALDLDAIVDFLRQKFKNVVLIGHSTGANKVVYYLSRPNKQKKVAGAVLAGPVSDIPSTEDELGSNYEKALELANDMIKKGEGNHLMPVELIKYLRTAQRFLSLSDQNSPEQMFPTKAFRGPLPLFRRIKIPVAIIIGEKDDYLDLKPEEFVKIFQKNYRGKDFASFIVPNSDHGFSDHEEEFANSVARWIQELQME